MCSSDVHAAPTSVMCSSSDLVDKPGMMNKLGMMV